MRVDPKPGARPGAALFALAFLALAIFLLTQIAEQAKFSANGKLVAQPAFWPGISLLGMAVFGAFHALSCWRTRVPGAVPEALIWARALEYFVWFMAYVQAAPLIGYLPATLIFTVLLAFRAGYRRPRTLTLAAATGLAIVLIFKTLLSVKIPGGAIYEYLPAALRNLMIVNF